ncbi:unknown [Dialister sp. CAG:588]|nr:unknown [Dialister sp. CAG:588]
MRVRISVAAAFVKVNTNKSVISIGCVVSVIKVSIRCTKTAVFPLPAAADNNKLVLRFIMAAVCSLVQFVLLIAFTSTLMIG